ncbi:MAG: trimeric intracellular cation channel family protein [Micropepsaceae bacterium]
MEHALFYLQVLGVGIFAASGAIVAAENKFDVIGATFLSVAAGLGAGTIVNLLTDQPVRWLARPELLWAALVAAVTVFELVRYVKAPERFLVWADAVGLAIFTATGMKALLALNYDPAVTLFLSAIGASGGGMIRDVLVNRPPLVFSGEIYVTAAVLGSLTYLMLTLLGFPEWWAPTSAILVTFLLRAAGITFQIRLRTGRIKSGQSM